MFIMNVNISLNIIAKKKIINEKIWNIEILIQKEHEKYKHKNCKNISWNNKKKQIHKKKTK